MYKDANKEPEALLEHAAHDAYLSVVDEDTSHLDEDASWLRDQRLSHKSLHWLHRPSVLMIGLVLFLFSFASSAAESSRQVIQYALACNSVSRDLVCDPTEAQLFLLTLQQALSVTLGVVTVLALAKVPSLSDQYGRKWFILVLVLVFLLGRSGRYLVTSGFPTTQFYLMVIVEAITNLLGGIATMLSLASCYVSDISEAHQRTYCLGINMAMFFTGLSIGPLVGNALLSNTKKSLTNGASPMYGPNLTSHDFLPLRFEIFILLVLFLFVLFVLPESRGKEARRMSRSLSRSLLSSSLLARPIGIQKPTIWEKFNVLSPLRIITYPKDVVHPLRHSKLALNRQAVITLVFVDCLIGGMAMALGEVIVLFSIFKFGFTAKDLGYFLTIGCSGRAIVLVLLSPFLSYNVFQKFFGFSVNKKRFDRVDYGLFAIGAVFDILGFFLLSVAWSKASFLSSFAVTSIGSLGSPALNSSVIKFFPESRIGEVFGCMALIKNIQLIFLPLLILGLYKTSLATWGRPEIVFWIICGVFVMMLVMATKVIVKLERDFVTSDDSSEISQ